MTKRVTILLNISLGLMIAYYALFFIGYFAQKQIIWRFSYDAYYTAEMQPVFSPVIIGFSLVTAAGAVLFNLLLRRNCTPGLYVGAEVFAGLAFLCDRLVKYFVPMMKTILLGKFGGSDGVFIGSLHAQSIGALDMSLNTFFVASLVLMICVCCVMQFGRKSVTQ